MQDLPELVLEYILSYLKNEEIQSGIEEIIEEFQPQEDQKESTEIIKTPSFIEKEVKNPTEEKIDLSSFSFF